MPKLSKIAKTINMGVSTIADILSKQGIEVEANPNTRIDNHGVEILLTQIRDKSKRDQLQSLLEGGAPATHHTASEAKEEETGVKSGLKVIGKVELDDEGNVIAQQPRQQTAAENKPEVKAEPEIKDRVEPAEKKPEKPAEQPKEAPRVEQKAPEAKPAAEQAPKVETAEKVEKKAEKKEPVREAKVEKPVEKAPVAGNTPATEKKPVQERGKNEERRSNPAVTEKAEVSVKAEAAPAKVKKDGAVKEQAPATPAVAEKPGAEAPVPAEEKTKSADDKGSDGVFRLTSDTPMPKVKVVGTIDLNAIKDGTRPKKKGNDRNKRGDKGGAGESGDRKRRKRIGQSKIDIEQAVKQPGFGSESKKKNDKGGQGAQGERRGGNNGGDRQRNGGRDAQQGGKDQHRGKRNVRQEISTEDVQKQVKETLARLTNKTTKKSVKYRKEKREEMHHRELEKERREQAESKVLKLTEFVTANDLAQMMDIPINNVISTCMSLGVMVSINQRLDAETINLVAEEFGFTTEYVSAAVSEAIATEEDREEDLVSRPPIVTVMGHVDHGKTSLLDYIRKANVIAGEAGGITQHIGAYNVELSDGRHITFLDTPGHEAFTAMRARGAKVTDLAIIIVAADDDVMPQTVEAINHASAAGVPIVFAINKIDKPTANPEKIKEELAGMNYLVEDWGGKYQSQDISAKKGIGVADLMDKVLLEAEMLELKANPNRKALGSVIESSLDKGRGYVATVLVQNGTLNVGDVVLVGTHYGKIRAMFNERNQRVQHAGPSTPVLVLGLNGAPTAGDTFNVMDTEQEAREIAGKREQLQREQKQRIKKLPGLDDLANMRARGDFHQLNLVVKGDVDGSVEALSDSLIKLSTPEVEVNVLHKGVGAISESDVTLAAASDAIIIGFQVRPSGAARKEAEKDGVEIRLYSVIYKAIEEVKDAMEGMLSPEIKEEITGTAEVLQTYHISKIGTIAGAMVRDGRIKRGTKVRVIRDGIVIYTGDLGSLKRFKDDVKDVVAGYECGLSVAGYNDIREGDMIEGFEEVEVKKTL